MKIWSDINNFQKPKNAVVSIGTFDGVHVGHQKLIKNLRQIAGKTDGETVLVSFYPHPRMVLFPDDNELKILNTEEEKAELLEKFGIDHLIVIPFTKKFSRLTSLEFIRDIVSNKIGTKKLVIGYNHHFGRNREGGFKNLKELGPVYGFEVKEISAIDVNNIEVSSTKIREALQKGNISKANSYLGYEYSLSGKVVKGNQLGKELGYPTANVEVHDKYKLVPADGIYAVAAVHDSVQYKGMMSIGFNPTVDGKKRTIEVNIFDFDKDIYGQELRVSFREWLRKEKKFSDLEKLKKQLAADKQATLKLF